MSYADAEAVILKAAAEGITPDAELWLDSWSEQNIIIPKGGAFEGAYSLAHTPYARRVLQCLSPSHPSGVVVAKVASQLFKTQTALNASLGWIYGAPANILILEPTTGLAKRVSSRLSKMIEVCPAVRDKIAAPRSRDKRNTLDTKEFDGGTCYIATAGSDANMAEIAARYVICDEIDRPGWAPSAEGDRVRIAFARMTTYEGISKGYIISSPTEEGLSRTDEWFERGTQEHYHVPCPHCGHLHELVRLNFRYVYDADSQSITRAWFVCPECKGEIEEHDKATMLPEEGYGGRARWVATAEGDGDTVSFTLSSYYAPMGSITWRKLAKELAQAIEAKERGNDHLLRVYTNTREGLSYHPGEQTTTAKDLQKRAQAEGLAPRVVPDWALVLTMWTDTQDNRLDSTVEAWGAGGMRCTIERRLHFGSPSAEPSAKGSVWQQLDALRSTPFAHASGGIIYISADGIDVQGHHTQDVYNYTRLRRLAGINVIGTRGANVRDQPIMASRPRPADIDWQGERIANGAEWWSIGTDTAKDHIANRLAFTAGPGSMHWHREITLGDLEELLVEKRVIEWVKGRKVRNWVKPNGARNEFLDAAVGNLAVFHYLGLHRWSDEDWRQLRTNICPKHATPDLFAVAEVRADAHAGERIDMETGEILQEEPDPPAQQQAAIQPAPAPTPQAPPPSAAPPFFAGRRVLSRGIMAR